MKILICVFSYNRPVAAWPNKQQCIGWPSLLQKDKAGSNFKYRPRSSAIIGRVFLLNMHFSHNKFTRLPINQGDVEQLAQPPYKCTFNDLVVVVSDSAF
jgi:hypothetical protein